ncbi:hypothetical protein Bca101_097122 [Brassica carinata]
MFVTLSFWIPWFRYSLLRRKGFHRIFHLLPTNPEIHRLPKLCKPHASHRVNKEAGHAAYKKDVETAIKHYSTAIEIDDEEISLITNRHAIHLKMESISFHIFFSVQFVNQDGDEAVAQEDEMVEEA